MALVPQEHDDNAPNGIRNKCVTNFGDDEAALQYHAAIMRREAVSQWLMVRHYTQNTLAVQAAAAAAAVLTVRHLRAC